MENIDISFLDAAMQKGVIFLHSQQLSYGEFDTKISSESSMENSNSSLASSPYITTFILHSISFLKKSFLVSEIIDKSIKFLFEDMDKYGIWRFYPENNRKIIYRDGKFIKFDMRIVPDLDDTACASYSLKSNHIYFPDNSELFYKYKTVEGTFQTWFIDDEKLLRKQDYIPPFNNICCGVNANVLMYLGDNLNTKKTSNYINEVIIFDKELENSSYFPNVIILYYLISRAYSKGVYSLELSRDRINEKILYYLNSHQSFLDLDIVSVIFAIASLLNLNRFTGDLNKWIDMIIDYQNVDGSWPIASFFIDTNKNHYGAQELSTAVALEAIAKFVALAK
jgi:hypothetical protein